jgi:hypothetical protein
MEIAYVKCPKCKKSFHCDANLLGLAIPLHCPLCDLYFEPQGAEGKKPMGGTAFLGLSKIDRQVIYLPSSAKRKPTRR